MTRIIDGLKHGTLKHKILGVFYEVYNELGHGFLESVYHRSLLLALESVGMNVCSRVAIPVWFRGHQVGQFQADILLENCVLLELKAARALDSSHRAQLELFESDGNRGWVTTELWREA